MRQLPRPNQNDVALLDGIIAAKKPPRRARLNGIREAVVAAYVNYDAVAPELVGLVPVVLSGDEREALVHAFEVDTAPLKELRRTLRSAVVTARCPFCGISESSTLNHYLPKELHPQFSVLSKNLVPSCFACNTRKRTQIVNEATNARLFLHPYFDALPNARFVTLDVEVRPDILVLRYEIVRPAGVSEAVHAHVQAHFRLLDLADRYRVMSLEELRGQHHALSTLYGAGEDATEASGQA